MKIHKKYPISMFLFLFSVTILSFTLILPMP